MEAMCIPKTPNLCASVPLCENDGAGPYLKTSVETDHCPPGRGSVL